MREGQDPSTHVTGEPWTSGYFITGTDTGVGKTLIACALLHRLRERGVKAVGMKPVAAGCQRTPQGLINEDVAALCAAGSVALPLEAINVYAFEPPWAWCRSRLRRTRPQSRSRCRRKLEALSSPRPLFKPPSTPTTLP